MVRTDTTVIETTPTTAYYTYKCLACKKQVFQDVPPEEVERVRQRVSADFYNRLATHFIY